MSSRTTATNRSCRCGLGGKGPCFRPVPQKSSISSNNAVRAAMSNLPWCSHATLARDTTLNVSRVDIPGCRAGRCFLLERVGCVAMPRVQEEVDGQVVRPQHFVLTSVMALVHQEIGRNGN